MKLSVGGRQLGELVDGFTAQDDCQLRRAPYGDGKISALLEWLRLPNQISESRHGQEPNQLAEPMVEAIPVRALFNTDGDQGQSCLRAFVFIL
jgi:hypothetical protein